MARVVPPAGTSCIQPRPIYPRYFHPIRPIASSPFAPPPQRACSISHAPKIPDFPTSAAAVAGQFSQRVHETSNPPSSPRAVAVVRPALSALTETVLAVPLWRRAVVAEPELVRPAAAETSVLGEACLACRACLRRAGSGESCAVLQLAAARSKPPY